MNGSYTAIGDIIKAISDLKRASLTDAEFSALLDATDEALDIAGALITDVFQTESAKPPEIGLPT